ncbi:MAG: pyridoxal kinase, partial [Terracoccus sp.]
NQFELEYLVGRTLTTRDDLLAAADELRARGPGVVLVTSVLVDDTPDGVISMACVTAEGAWIVSTPLLPMTVRGGGDVTAAVFLAHYLTDGPKVALARTAATMYAVLEHTYSRGSDEMLLVEAQDAIAHPPETPEVFSMR